MSDSPAAHECGESEIGAQHDATAAGAADACADRAAELASPVGLEAGQCRFCLVEESTPSLMAPCSCSGSARLVHPDCLIRWQRRQRGAASCEVCLERWALQLEPIDHECWVRAVQTNPRYPPCDEQLLPPEAAHSALALMRTGSLIVQTPTRAAQTGEQVLAASMASQGIADALALFVAAMSSSRAQHWHQGAFLIVHVGARDGTDGSNAIVAVNLACRRECEPRTVYNACTLHEALSSRAVGEVPTVRTLVGGPCHSSDRLCLLVLAPEDGGERTRRGDALRVDTDGGEHQVLVAEPHVAELRATGRRVLIAIELQGAAVWSSAQLLSEISRERWGICRARSTDIFSHHNLWQHCWLDCNPVHAICNDSPADFEAADGCS